MSRLNRIFAVISMLAGLLLLCAEVTYVFFASPSGATTLAQNDYIESIFFFVGAILLVLTSFGLYLYQHEKIGIFGFVAFFIACVGSILMVSSDFMALFARPYLMEQGVFEPGGILMTGYMINFLSYALGWMLFAIASLRAGLLPRAASITLMIGIVAVFVAGDLAENNRLIDLFIWLPWYGSYVWFGFAMLGKQQTQSHTEHVTIGTQATVASS